MSVSVVVVNARDDEGVSRNECKSAIFILSKSRESTDAGDGSGRDVVNHHRAAQPPHDVDARELGVVENRVLIVGNVLLVLEAGEGT